MRPRVILHNAVSLDSRVSGFMPDIALFYRLAQTWAEDATLAGSETILTAAAGEGVPDETAADQWARGDSSSGSGGAGDGGASNGSAGVDGGAGESEAGGGLLVVPDSRGRVRCWRWLLSQPYWARGVSLCSDSTPAEHLEYLRSAGVAVVKAGAQRVDLEAALERLSAEYGVRTLRADSGGSLNTALLEAGLVDEVSLLVHPCLVGAGEGSFYRRQTESAETEAVRLRLLSVEPLDGDLVWLRYAVAG